MQQPDLGTILGRVLREREWNERLARWSKPASDTEEAMIERAAGMVRRVIGQNSWLTDSGVEVVPQGSYFNNTNVRTMADMDLCVRHPLIKMEYRDGLVPAAVDRDLNYSDGPNISDVFARMRREIGGALVKEFGQRNVAAGGKAFTVSGVPGSRSDIDVVPAMRLHVVRNGGSLLFPYAVTEGVIIRPEAGPDIYNFPKLHHDNGKAKRRATQLRFKKVVRQMKSMRDDLVERGALRPKQVPSFLVECLVYLVDDADFCVDEEHHPRLRRILERCWAILASSPENLFEINGQKLLFGAHQPWSVQDAQAFLKAAYSRIET